MEYLSNIHPSVLISRHLLLVIVFGIINSLSGEVPLTIELTEECQIGTVVSRVAEYLNKLRASEFKTSGQVRFQLLNDDRISRLFSLHPTEGQLRVAVRIDRETVCLPATPFLKTKQFLSYGGLLGNKPAFGHDSPVTSECVLPLNILIISQLKQDDNFFSESTSQTTRILIHLVLTDINDHAPSWSQISPLHISFVETPSNIQSGWQPNLAVPNGLMINSEEPSSGQAKTIDRAFDPDAGLNGTIRYKLIGPGADLFKLDDGSDRLMNSFRMKLTSSGGSMESGFLGNGDLQAAEETPLSIWPVAQLDRETDEFAGRGGLFNLTLLAVDMGVPPKTGSTMLVISVTDVNDHTPVFQNDDGYGAYMGTVEMNENRLVVYRPPNGNIQETIPVGSVVVQLNATDRDAGAHAKLTYEFCPCDRNIASSYFKVDRLSGRIIVAQRLDYDSGPRQFKFKVIAKDGAPEPYTLTGTAMVEISLSDENDELPEIEVMLLHSSGPLTGHSASFGNINSISATGKSGATFLGRYSTVINENPSPETVVAYIQVTDRDHHGQDQVHCRLGPTDNFTLQVDHTVNQYSPAKMTFPSVHAGDGGGTLYKQYFRLVTGTSSSDVNSPSFPGLDRELTPVQLITVTCVDSVGNSGYITIEVQLNDVNDHAPEFANHARFAFQIEENRELLDGKPIWLGRALAVDKDSEANAGITYQLDNSESGQLDGNPEPSGKDSVDQLFELNAKTGDLYAKTVFDRETAPQDGVYRLRLLAIDSGMPRLTSTATVDITVLDVNDWPPQFTRDVYTFSVSEDARVQEVIGTVEAIDKDADSQGRITYHLAPPRQAHSSVTPEILTNNWSSRRIYSRSSNLELRNSATNTTNKSKSASVQSNSNSLARDVRDEKFTGLPKWTDSNERQRQKDKADSSPVLLLEPSSTPNYFSVDRLTGKIRLIRRLDRELSSFSTIEVVAIDSPPMRLPPIHHQVSTVVFTEINNTSKLRSAQTFHKTALSATATVVIAVTDVNDNAPVFRHPNSSTAIPLRLHETLGRQLLMFEAHDADEGDNSRITYHIRSEIPRPPQGPGTHFFAVDETSGALFVAKTINTTGAHRLVIEACDQGVGNTRRCSLSPSIRITVFDGLTDSHLQHRDSMPPADGANDAISGYGRHQNPSLSAESGATEMNVFGARSASIEATAGRRNEVIVVCLVIIFSLLLLATILLVVCLFQRRGAGTGEGPRNWLAKNRTGRAGSTELSIDTQAFGNEITALKQQRQQQSQQQKLVSINNDFVSGLQTNGDPWCTDGSQQFSTDGVVKLEKSLGYDSSSQECLIVSSLNPLSSPLSQQQRLYQPTSMHQHQSHGNGQLVFTPAAYSSISPSLFIQTPAHTNSIQLDHVNSRGLHLTDNSANNSLQLASDQGFTLLQRVSRDKGPPVVNDLMQSSYKPPSPDYQSLDNFWRQLPSPEGNQLHARIHSNRYPVHPQYAIGQPAVAANSNVVQEGRTRSGATAKFSSRFPVEPSLIDSQISSAFYELTGLTTANRNVSDNKNAWRLHQDHRHRMLKSGLLSDAASIDQLNGEFYGHQGTTATLGRPTTCKGKRRMASQDVISMHNSQAGELAVASALNKRSSSRILEYRPGVEQPLSMDRDDSTPKKSEDNEKSQHTPTRAANYTYQAYREGTFV